MMRNKDGGEKGDEEGEVGLGGRGTEGRQVEGSRVGYIGYIV